MAAAIDEVCRAVVIHGPDLLWTGTSATARDSRFKSIVIPPT
jgi:hypothetical protein